MSFPQAAIFPSAIANETNMLNWQNLLPGSTIPTLASSITSGATSATLTTGTGSVLPPDNFVVAIDNELIFVGSRSGDTLNSLTRGYEGTTGATHNSGAQVTQRVTALSHNQIVSEINAIETQLGANLVNVVKPSTSPTLANLGLTGVITTYNGQTTSGNGVSVTYATLGLTGQTASIGSTLLWAVPAATGGIYALYYTVHCTTAGTAGTVTLTISYTDDIGATSQTTATLSLSATGRLTGLFVFFANSSSNINYSTTVTGATGSPQYALRVRLVRF